MSTINLPNIEDEIFKLWQERQIFKATLEASKSRPLFNFYDGPPFATGSPHYGHILAATIKDTVCRFQTINGCYVPRLNGWDTHGLPIEQLGEKTLGIKIKLTTNVAITFIPATIPNSRNTVISALNKTKKPIAVVKLVRKVAKPTFLITSLMACSLFL
jgi:isoleucyl-tRNA synthetase